MQFRPTLPGGEAKRPTPAGRLAGVSRSRIQDPASALASVAHELAQAEDTLRTILGTDVGAVHTISTYLADSGGKRLRPALTALGCRAVGIDPMPIPLLCCGELIHLGSLLHDDVVDQGDVRRGRPAAHVVFGNASAVLTGDFCVARALLTAIEEGGAATGMELAATVAAMAEGEVIQLQRAGDLDNTLDVYLDVIDRKCATLIAWCTAAGAWTIGNATWATALSTFGRGVGRAFQITDDVLDFRTTTDKLPGADLRERKVTLPLLHAMQRMPGLKERLKAGPPTPEELPELLEAVRNSGALEAALNDARSYVKQALDALQTIPDSPARDALAVLARTVVERSS